MSTSVAPRPQLIGLVACLAVVGCIDEGTPGGDTMAGSVSESGGTSESPTTSDDPAATSNNEGGPVTTIDGNDTDAGGEDYGGPEWDTSDDLPQGTDSSGGGNSSSGTGGTTGGTGGSDSSTTAESASGSSEETDAGNVTFGPMTDEGGEDYGGAPPDDPDGEI